MWNVHTDFPFEWIDRTDSCKAIRNIIQSNGAITYTLAIRSHFLYAKVIYFAHRFAFQIKWKLNEFSFWRFTSSSSSFCFFSVASCVFFYKVLKLITLSAMIYISLYLFLISLSGSSLCVPDERIIWQVRRSKIFVGF